ncbi:MAG TPA: cytochrome c [Burkholderiales bacterium]|nr:cytochrome c [Burkholderiales bacterium]
MTAQRDSAYPGWRLFQSKCATCHGPDATGTDRAPDLRPRVKDMSESRFVGTVLRRYTWIVPSGEALSEGAAREAFIEDVLRGKKGDIAMPAWEGDPAVTASIRDLYTYLRARAEGTLGPGRPPH